MPRIAIACLALLSLASSALAQPPARREPIPRLSAGGPTGFVTAVALSPDGRTLYAAGYDQVVRVWTLTDAGSWKLDPFAFRVPIGPGVRGAVNAIAVSPDGLWLAAGGQGVTDAGFRQTGFVVPEAGLSADRFFEQGLIHVWNTRDRSEIALRGHAGVVIGLAFGEARDAKPPLLLSVAEEVDSNYQYFGGVRVWDPANKPESAQLASMPLPKIPDAHVGLALWNGLSGPVAAIGWGDGKLRRWDVAGNRVQEWADSARNEPLVALPDQTTFLTASDAGDAGQLRSWDRSAAAAPPVVRRFAAGFIPRALAPFSSKADGAPDYVAVVLEKHEPLANTVRPFHMLIIRLSNWETVQTVPLWQGRHNWPTLAAAPRSRHLVAAGNDDHEIQVFAIDQLLKGAVQPERLHSAGATFRQAAFIQNGASLGLSLNENAKAAVGQAPRPPQAGDLLLDLTKRKMASDPTGWKLATAEPGEWGFRLSSQGEAAAVTVRQGNADRATVTLRPGQRVTDVAVLPPGKWYKNPILAVASEARLQPFLALYDGDTGEQFRLCTGHTDPIRSLAFSADGRMLVSAAEDQTVCVWSLTNLDKVLGTRGLIRGLPVKEDGGRLLLGRPDPDRISSENDTAIKRSGAREGDEVEGLVEPAGVQKLATVGAFYKAVSQIKPGQPVTLRFAQRGDVALTVGQAIDERKPLFTLFVNREGRAEERDWVGWSPFGPYEYSDRKAERWIGWHFNPVQLATGATFDSPAEQYHKEFFREGILKHLLASGEIAPALQEWEKEELRKPLPRPVMKPWIEGVKPDADRVVLRQPPTRLNLMIGNFPSDRIAALTWQVGDGPKQPFEPGGGVERSADLSKVEWKRGPATIRVSLTTRAEEPQTFVEELPIRYQAAAPTLPAQEPRRLVDQEKFTWTVAVRPNGDHPARVHFRQFHNEQEVANAADPKEVTLPGATKQKSNFTLRPGLNRLEVSATNADAGTDAEWETAKLALLVEYQPRPLPRLSLDSVVPLLDKDRTPGEAVIIPAEQHVAVSRPVVRLKGAATADEELSDVLWAFGDTGGRTLDGFSPGKKEFAFQTQIPLNPGPNIVRISAKAKSGGASSQRVTIDYQPELPRAEITLPGRGQQFAGSEPVEIRARVLPADEPTAYSVALLVNGQPAGAAQTPKLDGEELIFRAPLTAGPNRLELLVKNEWGAKRLSEAVPVRLVQPPTVQAEAATATTDKPLVSLLAVVKSKLPVNLDSIQVRVNDEPTPVRVEVPTADGETRIWLRDIPLTAGRNVVKMWVRNDDARSAAPAEWVVTYTPPPKPPAPPAIEFVEPAGDLRVIELKLSVKLRVTSTEPLTRVELRREGGNPLRHEFDLAAVKPDARGVAEFQAEIDLIPGPNPLRALVVSAGGQREAGLVVSYLQEPVELTIEKITAGAVGGPALFPKVEPNGRLSLDRPASDARVFLHGSVYWSREDDEQFKTAKQVRVFVNGFQQQPGDLQPFKGVRSRNRPERKFVVELTLNREKDNRIEVVLPGLKQRSANRREVAVDCARPEIIRRLHVFPVVVRDKVTGPIDAKQLEGRLRELLPSAAKAQVLIHGPLVKYVDPNQVMGELIKLKRFFDGAVNDGSTGDLAVIYYQGPEQIKADGHFLLTSVSAYDPNPATSAVSCTALADVFGQSMGATLLLLDLNRLPGDADKLHDAVAQWPDQPNVSVFRYWRRSPGGPRLLGDLTTEIHAATKLSDVATDFSGKFVWKSEEWAWAVPGADSTYADWRIPVNLGGLRVK